MNKSKGFIQHHFLNKDGSGKSNASVKSGAGFTIIELLVVVAIIAVLTGIVLVNVTAYIAKGKNASIKGDLSTIRTNAAVYYDGQNPSTYVGYAASTGYTSAATPAATLNGGTALTEGETSTAFCACGKLLDITGATNQTFCVDSTGQAKQTATACGTECATGTNWICQ